MLIPLLLTSLAQAMPHPDAVRPEGHIYRHPWWNRPRPAVLPLPEAVDPPPFQPYSLGEFDPIEAVLLTTWYEDWGDTWTTMIGALVERGVPVYLCESPVPASTARTQLTNAGVDVDSIDFIDCNVDSVWIRDYGPFFAMDQDGASLLGDAAYYEYAALDDDFPTQASERWGDPLYQVPLSMEGGNFYANGAGACVSTTVVWNWYDVSEEEATRIFQETLGCDEVYWLDPLENEGTGHVDMYFTFVDADTVIVGSYEPSQDAANAALLDDQADTMAAAGFTVHRVPMLPSDDGNGDGWADFRTVINGFFANTDTGKVFLMPTYDDDYPSETAAAQEAMQEAMPDVEIVPVPADDVITYGGAIHCVVKTFPVPAWPDPCNDPYDFNDVSICDAEDEDDDEKAGCGCSSSPAPVGWIWFGLPLLVATRRRR